MENQNQEQQEEQQLQQHSMNPATNLLYQPPFTTPVCSSCFNNNMKRRSPSSSAIATLEDPSYGGGGAATTEHRATKKVFREQQDLTTNLNGFSTILFPQNTKPLCHAATTFHSPEDHANAVTRASSLSPLPPHSVKGYVCDPNPNSPARTFSPSSQWGTNKGMILTKEEASDSMRMRRMKECMREMRKWWDEGMRHEDEEDEPEGAEGDKVLSKDKCGGGEEEAVSLEWADKCLSICFKCPCSKGYQILLSGNNCYYKLV
ncbi:uncharacterized protein LOC133315861 [Gastrolobium bilobum]|uniref:uncharacterized protein LOC133315861 n=1 Tax=Gastrolobium bilobum TaxID=150636 RepID=UPI002AB3206E|nr:uncharacterized protein LOC133315861 [Gastrolobium bilobum]